MQAPRQAIGTTPIPNLKFNSSTEPEGSKEPSRISLWSVDNFRMHNYPIARLSFFVTIHDPSLHINYAILNNEATSLLLKNVKPMKHIVECCFAA